MVGEGQLTCSDVPLMAEASETYGIVGELSQASKSSTQAFVAMWFSDEMTPAYTAKITRVDRRSGAERSATRRRDLAASRLRRPAGSGGRSGRRETQSDCATL